MSGAEDGNVGHDKRPRFAIKGGWRGWLGFSCFAIFTIFLSVTLSIFLTSLIIFMAPSFTVNDVKIYAFNVSTATSTLTSNLEITISSENEDFQALHFDQLDIYASYRNQPITLPVRIPPEYLGSPDTTTWSPYVNGTKVPLPPDLVVSLSQDVTAGTVVIHVKVTGRIRSKFGYVTTRYRLKVNCPVHVMFGNSNDVGVLGSSVKRSFYDEGCGVDTTLVLF